VPLRGPNLFSIVLILLLHLPLVPSSTSQLRYTLSAFHPTESLTYKVKWSFIRLGTLTVQQEPADTTFPEYMNVWLNGESSVPLVDVFFKSVSLLHRDNPTSWLYELQSGRSASVITAYIYDPENIRMFGMEYANGESTRLDTLAAPVPYYDGVGLFMYARAASGSDTSVSLPTIMDFQMGKTNITFTSQSDSVEIDAFDGYVPAYLFTGFTEWTGSSFAGMTGDFRGWVSRDSARTVLRAEVKIVIGSVVIELERGKTGIVE